MATNPVEAMENEMEIETVPEKYMDIISGDVAYDPVRLPLEQDPTQLLYNRNTLETIWETEQHARNPFTRKWFDIKSAIPQTELRKEMKRYIKLHGLPSNTVIAGYSKILEVGEMERYLRRLLKSVQGKHITEKQWVKIWKKTNIVRLFCEFHSENIETFLSLHGFRYFKKVIHKSLIEKKAKQAALDVGKETVRAIDVIITGLKSRKENSIGIIEKLRENSKECELSSLIKILGHVYKNNQGYMKIDSFILRAFSTVFDEIAAEVNIVLGNSSRATVVGYPCALEILCERNAIDISSEDLNHGITILERARNSLLYLEAFYVRALVNAVSICISREFERLKEMSGLKAGQHLEAEVQAQQNSEALEAEVQAQHNSEALEAEVQTQHNSEALEAEVQAQQNSEALEAEVQAQLNSEALEDEVQAKLNSEDLEGAVQAQQNSEALEAEVQAQHNSEALQGGVRLIRDILMEEESPLAPRILGRALDIVKELVHMFERFCETEDEVGDRNFSRFICVNNCEIHCVHYRIAQDGLDISEAISRKRGPLLDVDVLRKFVSDLTEDISLS